MLLKFSQLAIIILLIIGCVHKPQPFQIALAGYNIRFPVTSKELRSKHPNAVESLLEFLTDKTKDVETVWRFENSIRDPRSQPYGVLITMRNKSHKMDSMRTALENKYHQSFQPLLHPQHLGKNEYYEPDSTLIVMQINDDVQLSISQRKIWPHGRYQFTNDVVISICYNLDTTEKERFAMKQGDVRSRSD